MTPTREVTVLGGGGHAKVVISTLAAAGFVVVHVLDDDARKWGTQLLGVPVVGPLSSLDDNQRTAAVVAVGANALRRDIVARFPNVEWVSAVHPCACIHASARVGNGTVIFAGAVVQPDSWIGAHVIVNTCASVDHDCVIDDYVHLAPGSRLAGGVNVGAGALVGMGAAVLPGRTIGQWAVLGACGVLTDDLPGGITAVGVPARPSASGARS